VQRAFESRARLSQLRGAAELLDARLAAAAPLRLERDLEPRRRGPATVEAYVALAAGTRTAVATTADGLELVASLDGTASLGAAVQATAGRLGLGEAQAARLRREATALCRELLELGALRFA
jgi:hypothetical protein